MTNVTIAHAANAPPGLHEWHGPWPATHLPRLRTWAACAVLAFGGSGCSSLHTSQAQLQWVDLQGDRGEGVAQRDLQACSAAVESRRSLITSCMAARGWRLADR